MIGADARRQIRRRVCDRSQSSDYVAFIETRENPERRRSTVKHRKVVGLRRCRLPRKSGSTNSRGPTGRQQRNVPHSPWLLIAQHVPAE
jgi:hypothetical protein